MFGTHVIYRTACGLVFLAGLGCSQREDFATKSASGGGVEARVPMPAAKPPNTRILFQPMFIWDGKKPTRQGTGFLAKGAKDRIAAVTSAHFLSFTGPPLKEVRWLDVTTREPLATFSTSWGQPGNRGTPVDLRPDYFICPVTTPVPPEQVLELDDRPLPGVGERVWFPDKDSKSATELGFEVVEGVVNEAEETHIHLKLDRPIRLQSQSGSPVISQATGKVIGTFARGHPAGTDLFLTPASSILRALGDDSSFPALEDVVGRKSR